MSVRPSSKFQTCRLKYIKIGSACIQTTCCACRFTLLGT